MKPPFGWKILYGKPVAPPDGEFPIIHIRPEYVTPLISRYSRQLSPRGEALTKARITLFAEKMKFAEFFSGKGEAFERGKIKTYPLSSAYADTFPDGESKGYGEIKKSLFFSAL